MLTFVKRIFSGGVWVVAGKIVTSVGAIVINGILARLLVPDEMGAYFLTFSLVAVFSVAAQFGLNHTVVKLVAESLGVGDRGRADKAVRMVLTLGIAGVMFVAVVFAFALGPWLNRAMFESELLARAMPLVALWIAVIAAQGLVAESLRGFHDIRLATAFGGALTSVLCGFLFAGLWYLQGHSDLNQIIVFSVVGVLINVIAGIFYLGRKLGNGHRDSDLSIRSVLEVAWPIWFTSLTLIVLTQADLWIVGMFRTSEDVALYGAATRFAVIVSMPLMIINAVAPPLIADSFAQGKTTELSGALQAVALIATVPALIILTVFIFLGDVILGGVFGPFYTDGATLLIILGIGHFLNVWAGPCGAVLLMTGNQTSMMWISLICGVINIVAALWAVHHFGLFGVAVVSAVTLALQNALMVAFVKMKTGMWTYAWFARSSCS